MKKKKSNHFLGNWRGKKYAKTEKPEKPEIQPAEACAEPGEARAGWYPETAPAGKENPKKIRLPRRKNAADVPELSPLQSGSTDIVDILAPSSVDL